MAARRLQGQHRGSPVPGAAGQMDGATCRGRRLSGHGNGRDPPFREGWRRRDL